MMKKEIKKRSKTLRIKTYKFVYYSFEEERSIEIFITVGKNGQSPSVKMEEIMSQFEEIQGKDKILSLPNFIFFILRKEIKK